MRLLVIADTHLRGDSLERMPRSVLQAAAAVDAIVHAGDIVTAEVLDRLAELAPVHAVLGNNDEPALADCLPQTLELEAAGVSVVVVHDSGARVGRAARLTRRFPAADVVVFGHSHVPVDELGVGRQRLFNPGSPTQRRRQPAATFGRLEFRDGELVGHQIVEV